MIRPIAIAVTLTFFCGCSSTPVPDSLLLSTPLPQGHVVREAPEQVWPLVCQIAEEGDSGSILSRNEESRLISWTTILKPDAEGHASMADVQLTEGREVPALTTVQVEARAGASVIHIRQVYFPRETAGGISHSRGHYEQEFIADVKSRLAGITQGFSR